ncbi:outer membrane lipoprotein carrier protein LolA [Rheinheimera sp. D18]|uniref:outer membrane lipoprotein carrier protein LolA n=1 Tax=Rheinheimera sp. D18 TaxID=2545632 RepID=UPI001052E834|nr:outer membrane lipoprotein carrier protein LolA [Rheinheimera sp. D18]QBL10691.1 outer membrane lipoprotein carrier protein LolA [Rheinheimera sp. D18]
MRTMRFVVILLCGLFSVLAQASTDLLPWQPLQGKVLFTQIKNLQGLPVPLSSSGYLDLAAQQMLWHTITPVDSKLLITTQGVSQWQQQEYVAITGSEFVGQLMLAVLQQNVEFIQQQFNLALDNAGCTLLQPKQAPLDQLFTQIILCGETELNSVTLQEQNGNSTIITLQVEAAAQ